MEHCTETSFSRTQSIVFMLTNARNLATADMDAAFRLIDITGQQISNIPWLGWRLAAVPLEIAKHLGIDIGLMTRTLEGGDAKGLLKRSSGNPDRRVSCLKLTLRPQEKFIDANTDRQRA